MTIGRPIEFDPDVVLKAAMELFWRKGYESSSLQDLLLAMNLSKSSFYQTFKSKYLLFQDCIRYYLKLRDNRLEAELKNAGSGKVFIENLLYGIATETLGKEARRGCFMMNTASEFAQTDAEIAKLISNGIDDLTDLFETVIKQAQQQKEISASKDTRSLAIYLVSNISGMKNMVKAGADRETIKRIADIILTTII